MIYKGYTKNNGKKPVDPLKGVKEFRTFEEVKSFDSFGGVLADNAIMIDIDDPEQSEILMDIIEAKQLNCQVIRTSRGKHFTFADCAGVTKCGTGLKLACGLTADIKVGSKNAVECLKIDGKKRVVEWEYIEEEPSILPKWLFPVSSKTDFFHMEEGEGRDSALFGYILTLCNNGFSKDEAKECINIINEYILSDSLSSEDIERITRDEAFPEDTFYDGKKFLHNQFALFLKNNNHIKRIDGRLCVYKDGVYVSGDREIEAQMVKYIPTMKSAQRTEVLKFLDLLCPADSPVADAVWIAFNNCLYNLSDDLIYDFSPDIVVTNKIPFDYNEDAYSEITDKTLDKISCNDSEIRSLLEEAIGYCFYRRNEMSKAFFLTGEGANGKSTFLDLINYLVGDENRSNLGLEELDERFSIAMLSQKLINIGDDISDEFWHGKSTSNFRKLVSGNEVKAEFKGQDAFFFKPYAKFFFSANALPRLRSKGFEAIKRRLVIIPFNAKFTKDDPDYDPYISYKLKSKESAEYLIQLGLCGLKRVLKAQDFTKSQKVEKEVENYELENNPILLWLQEYGDQILNQPTKDVHKAYRIFCFENGFSEMTLTAFSREIHKRLGFEVKRFLIDGKLTGVYVKG